MTQIELESRLEKIEGILLLILKHVEYLKAQINKPKSKSMGAG
jgi:hypothetical protein